MNNFFSFTLGLAKFFSLTLQRKFVVNILHEKNMYMSFFGYFNRKLSAETIPKLCSLICIKLFSSVNKPAASFSQLPWVITAHHYIYALWHPFPQHATLQHLCHANYGNCYTTGQQYPLQTSFITPPLSKDPHQIIRRP